MGVSAKTALSFGVAIVIGGVLSGIAGAVLSLLLHLVEHAVYGYTDGIFLEGVSRAPRWRRFVGPLLGGIIVGCGWWWLRRTCVITSITQMMERRPRKSKVAVVVTDAILQVILVGTGASLGRETAPRQAAAALTRWVATPLNLSEWQCRVLIAAAAGGGLAAVYDVPISGAIFAVQCLLGTWELEAFAVAFAVSLIATVTAFPVICNEPTYHWLQPHTGWLELVWTVAAVPLCLVVGHAFSTMMRRARHAVPEPSIRLPIYIGLASAITGFAAWWLPDLPGNGRSVLFIAVGGGGAIAASAAMVLLKPITTSLFLGAGATGGIMTPSLATGAALGSFVALSINAFTPVHASIAVFAVTGAAGILAITQKSGIYSGFFAWELANPPIYILLMLLATALLCRIAHDRLTRRSSRMRAPLTTTPKMTGAS